ncbi:hypothetical protein GCM10010452_21980 [Crossiella cryophila]
MAQIRSRRAEGKVVLPDGDNRDQLVTPLAVGHETAAPSLFWCQERLVRHPARTRQGD